MLQVPSNVFKAVSPVAPVSLRLLRPDALDGRDQAAWDELGAAAEAPSVFAEPWVMRQSLAHCDAQGAASLAVVEDEGGWVGAMPVVPVRRQGRTPVPAWMAWRHPNQFVGAPLVRRGRAICFWRGLIDGLGASGRRVALVLGQLPTDDRATDALLHLCDEQGRAFAIDRRIARACFRSDAPPDQCAKQRSRIRGLERKLSAEVGPVALELVRDAGEIGSLLETFLTLEQSGWKGRAGSALACADETRGFFDEVCRAGAANGRLELATLLAGDRILAISTQLDGAGWLYGFKAAYDEAFARYAPGLLLLDRLTRAYVERGGIQVDSCAVPDQQPVSRLWPMRRELIDCRVALGGTVRARLFGAMLACERAAHAIRPGG